MGRRKGKNAQNKPVYKCEICNGTQSHQLARRTHGYAINASQQSLIGHQRHNYQKLLLLHQDMKN